MLPTLLAGADPQACSSPSSEGAVRVSCGSKTSVLHSAGYLLHWVLTVSCGRITVSHGFQAEGRKLQLPAEKNEAN